MATERTEASRLWRTAEQLRHYWQLRIGSELSFARALLERNCDVSRDAGSALAKAEKAAGERLATAATRDLETVAAEIEAMLDPFAATARGFSVYCVGHAHIDMNWMWGWQETVATTNDTFTTVTRLLREYPDAVFSQSQASVFRILEQYNGDLLDAVRELVQAGRIEVTASHWVETDKNIVTGESLVRHLLYTRQYMRDLFGLSAEDVPIDWSPDTFGHARTVPTYLVRGGVRYLYLHRPGTYGTQPRPTAFWWLGPDGSKVLVRNDMHYAYNGVIGPAVLESTVLRSYDGLGLPYTMFVYGVGDHGGGPTRRDLEMLADIGRWPVFPSLIPAKTVEFFRRLEGDGAKLPVLDEELNFEFTGCYTTQTLIKRANAYGVRAMLRTEAASSLAHVVRGFPYPAAGLREHWRNTLFHHFHDILPGSGVRDTRTYTHGLYQESMAFAGVASSQALRGIAAAVNTEGAEPLEDSTLPTTRSRSMGAGIGKGAVDGALSAYAQGSGRHVPVFVAFNLGQADRTTVVRATIWDREEQEHGWEAVLPDGSTVVCQLLEKGNYWAHDYQVLAFPLEVGGFSYASFRVRPAQAGRRPQEIAAERSAGHVGVSNVCHYAAYERGPEGLENEFLSLEIDPSSGGIRSLTHKPSGIRFVADCASVLEYVVERARSMSAWTIEHEGEVTRPRLIGLTRSAHGPHVAQLDAKVEVAASRFTICYRLEAGDPRLYIDIRGTWFERGGPAIGTPVLRFAVPVALDGQESEYEIPFGSIVRRMQHGEEVPALRWAAVTGTSEGKTAGILVASDSKHGYSLRDGSVRLTLIRSSYDPDPLPEVGEHEVKLSLEPFAGTMPAAAAMHRADALTEPLEVVETDSTPGDLPVSGSFLSVAGEALVSSVKQSEDGGGLVVRLYNPSDRPVEASICAGDALPAAVRAATLTDLLERDGERVDVDGGKVSLPVPPHGICTVRLALAP